MRPVRAQIHRLGFADRTQRQPLRFADALEWCEGDFCLGRIRGVLRRLLNGAHIIASLASAAEVIVL